MTRFVHSAVRNVLAIDPLLYSTAAFQLALHNAAHLVLGRCFAGPDLELASALLHEHFEAADVFDAARLSELGYRNVEVRIGDGYAGWPDKAPFDGIVVTAAAPHVPPALIEQLKPGGRLVIPVGTDGWAQHLKVITKRADGGYDERNVLPVRFVPLVPGKR